ncbi:hypothetical protein EVAR_97772_1 [Eumeta japonica]|uniref:Uncharacterized protein n=1 Tax=Eumeta variegata TaxID=151549 RepID=A0A4C1Y914_EUMVA|nr:hypothetical protein EVAR_97772_1 [Eumeta japonica]
MNSTNFFNLLEKKPTKCESDSRTEGSVQTCRSKANDKQIRQFPAFVTHWYSLKEQSHKEGELGDETRHGVANLHKILQ